MSNAACSKLRLARKEGSHSYYILAEKELARIIRVHQSLGSSLSEIGAMITDYEAGSSEASRTAQLLTDHIGRLEERQAEIAGMIAFLRAKLTWLDDRDGEPPRFKDFRPRS